MFLQVMESIKLIFALFLLHLAGMVSSEEISFLHIDTKEVDSSEFGGPPGQTPTTCNCGWTNKVTNCLTE